MKNGRIYVVHTFYHLYISMLKEVALPLEKRGNATVVLSKMSNDFGNIAERLVKSGVFKELFLLMKSPKLNFPNCFV